MNNIQITDYISVVHQRLARGGVFLTVKHGDKLNTMTIGWGGITNFWSVPVFIVPVRQSRYTYSLINGANDFSVSIPVNVSLKKALAYCGSHSGRDVDKYKEAGLSTISAKTISSPIISQCDLHFECKIVYQQLMDPNRLDPAIKEKWYPDYHTMYYGKILAGYLIDPQ